MSEFTVNVYSYQDFDLVTRAVESVPNDVDTYVIDGRLGTFPQIGGTDVTPGLADWCDSRDNVIYSAPPEDRLPYGGENPSKYRMDMYEQAMWAYDEVLPQDTWTIKMDSDELLLKIDRSVFDELDERVAYRPLWFSDGDRKSISPRVRVPEHWTPSSHDMMLPRREFPRDTDPKTLFENKKQEQDTPVLREIKIEHRGHDRSDEYMRAKVGQMENLGIYHRATSLAAEHGVKDPIRVSHVVPDIIERSSSSQISLLAGAMSKDLDIYNTLISTREVPIETTVDTYGNKFIYPGDLINKLSREDSDIILMQTPNGQAIRSVRSAKEHGLIDSKVAVCFSGDLLKMVTRDMDLDLFYDVVGFADAIICRGSEAMESMSEFHEDTQVVEIPPVVDPEKYDMTGFMEHGTLNIVMAGYLGKNTIPQAPILAVRKMLDGGQNVRMAIVDWADEGVEDAIVDLIEGYEKISYMKEKKERVRNRVMEQADVVCVPVIHQNSVPGAVLEGMASGSMVVTGSYGPSLDYSVTPTSPSDWKSAMESIKRPDNGQEKMMIQNKKKSEQYDYRSIVENHYKELFNRMAQ